MKKFEVGMKVLCIKDHSKKTVKKGNEYVVRGIKRNECCDTIVLDVGIDTTALRSLCVCGRICQVKDGIYWLISKLFIPVEEFQQVTYTKIIEEIPMGVN